MRFHEILFHNTFLPLTDPSSYFIVKESIQWLLLAWISKPDNCKSEEIVFNYSQIFPNILYNPFLTFSAEFYSWLSQAFSS